MREQAFIVVLRQLAGHACLPDARPGERPRLVVHYVEFVGQDAMKAYRATMDRLGEDDPVGRAFTSRDLERRVAALLRDALQMRHELYPLSRYPEGHSEVADSLSNLARLLKDERIV